MSRVTFEVLRPSTKTVTIKTALGDVQLPISFAIRRAGKPQAGIEWCDRRRLRFFLRDGVTYAVKAKGKRKQRAASYCPPSPITRWDYI